MLLFFSIIQITWKKAKVFSHFHITLTFKRSLKKESLTNEELYMTLSLVFSISYNKVVSYDIILFKINKVVKKQN